MILNIVPLIVLAFASYRITRFLVIDSLIEGSRHKLYAFLSNRADKNGPLHLIWSKLFELSSCTWCAGWWLSLGLYSLYAWVGPQEFSRLDVINVFAIAGIQGLLHAFEPDEA